MSQNKAIREFPTRSLINEFKPSGFMRNEQEIDKFRRSFSSFWKINFTKLSNCDHFPSHWTREVTLIEKYFIASVITKWQSVITIIIIDMRFTRVVSAIINLLSWIHFIKTCCFATKFLRSFLMTKKHYFLRSPRRLHKCISNELES